MRRLPPLVAGLVLITGAAAPVAAQSTPLSPIRESGQSVTPVYEGWYKNRDGTYSLSFGYFNRNAKEVVEVPIGTNNFIAPGPADQGQPAAFAPRRHWGVFTVKVPKALAQGEKVTWTLVVRGDTMRIPGHMRPQWQIDALEGEAGSGNTPPEIRFTDGGPAGAGPGGIVGGPVTAHVGKPADLKAWVTDDGNARNSVASGGRQGVPVTLMWFKHTGPGAVSFASVTPRAQGANGLAATTATFSAPGDYMLRLRANDASGVVSGGHSQCCWSNGFLKVSVLP